MDKMKRLRDAWLDNPDDISDFLVGFVVGAFLCGMCICAALVVIG